MNTPLVSVILPTYNRARLLRPAVESVLAQTYRHLELVVVDDGSTDDTVSMLETIPDERLRVLRLEENRGASHARNIGIERTTGPLIGFLDSDDAWHHDKLERQIGALDNASDRVGLCVCSRQYGRPEAPFPVLYSDEEMSGDAARARIASGVGFSTPCWLIRRDALVPAGGFDETLPRLQDYECSIRIAERWNVLLMSDVLVSGELQPDSLSESADRYTQAIEIIFQRHAELFCDHPRGHSHMTFRAGKYLAIEGRCREAVPWFMRALRIQPTNMRAAGGALLCITGLFGLLRRMKYAR